MEDLNNCGQELRQTPAFGFPILIFATKLTWNRWSILEATIRHPSRFQLGLLVSAGTFGQDNANFLSSSKKVTITSFCLKAELPDRQRKDPLMWAFTMQGFASKEALGSSFKSR